MPPLILLCAGYLLVSLSLHAPPPLFIAAAVVPPAVSFSYNFSVDNPSTYNQNLIFQGDALEPQPNGPVNLTCNSLLCSKVGRMSYAHPVQLYTNTSGRHEVASFSTSFTFAIWPIVTDNKNTCRGDGMAFFLASFPSKGPPYQSAGSNLGLISDGKTNSDIIPPEDRFIAVEFDIGIESDQDPKERTDHIAIDINSVLKSANITHLPTNVTLNGTMIADIVFNSSTWMLVASLGFLDHPSSSPPAQPVQVSANLSSVMSSNLLPQVAVGFSAATAICVELSQILSWSFNSTLPLIDQDRHNWKRFLGELIVGGAVALALVVWFLLSCWKQKIVQNKFEKGTCGFRRFEYSDLAAATGHFSHSRKLGQGAFGVVYRGFLKRLGREVAVKKIVRESREGLGLKDFFAEVSTISEARHKNLVRFYGWCCRGHSWNILHLMCCCFRTKKNKELFLVYELVKNGNLYDYLYKSEADEVLSWKKRYEIAKDIGSGLLYLHHECNPYILHRDIKPGNVLLDDKFNAKLADFGLSRVANPDNETLQTTAVGSEGYLDPQCMRDGKVRFNRSSDVYSFGIVLLEIVCARKHREQIWRLYQSSGDVVVVADSRLTVGVHERSQMERVIVLGLWCSAFETEHRPTMRQAMDVLERDAPLPDLKLIVNSTLASTDQDASSSPPVGNRYNCEEAPLVAAASSSSQLSRVEAERCQQPTIGCSDKIQ